MARTGTPSRLPLNRFGHAGPVRPRSANEWRSFWHQGGEAELAAVLGSVWPPLAGAGEEAGNAAAERVALLLGSAAPARALAAELGRIRTDLGAGADPVADAVAADAVHAWFEARRPAGGVWCDS
jgi:hypothetical protein